MGSTSDPQRQGLILISATDDGQPRIDVMNGVSGKTLAGCLHARMAIWTALPIRGSLPTTSRTDTACMRTMPICAAAFCSPRARMS